MGDGLHRDPNPVVAAPDCEKWEGVTDCSRIGSLGLLAGARGMWPFLFMFKAALDQLQSRISDEVSVIKSW